MAEIKFVRVYNPYGNDWYDAVYQSGRIRAGVLEDAPQTIKNFIVTAKIKREQYDKLFKRYETIYK